MYINYFIKPIQKITKITKIYKKNKDSITLFIIQISKFEIIHVDVNIFKFYK